MKKHLLNSATEDMQTVEAYKRVLIVGNGMDITLIKKLYEQQGDLLIGDGKQALNNLDLSVLKGKINQDTRIDINSHGAVRHGRHYIGVGTSTKDFLAKIAANVNGQPLHIHLHACYAGAASPDVSVLPEGSVLIAHASKHAMTVKALNRKSIVQLNQDLKITNPVQDFVTRFAMNVKQTAVISIKKSNGIFQHTIRLPKNTLTTPNKVQMYLEKERSKFVDEYNKAFSEIRITQIPKITEQEAIDWRNDNFIMLIARGDKSTLTAFEQQPDRFSDYINHSLQPDGSTALMEVATMGKNNAVQILLKSDVIEINAKDSDGLTALMCAANAGYVNVVQSLINLDRIDVNAKDSNGFTALIFAAYYGHYKVAQALLTSKTINVTIKANAGFTASEIATYKSHENIASIINQKISEDAIDSSDYESILNSDSNFETMAHDSDNTLIGSQKSLEHDDSKEL